MPATCPCCNGYALTITIEELANDWTPITVTETACFDCGEISEHETAA